MKNNGCISIILIVAIIIGIYAFLVLLFPDSYVGLYFLIVVIIFIVSFFFKILFEDDKKDEDSLPPINPDNVDDFDSVDDLDDVDGLDDVDSVDDLDDVDGLDDFDDSYLICLDELVDDSCLDDSVNLIRFDLYDFDIDDLINKDSFILDQDYAFNRSMDVDIHDVNPYYNYNLELDKEVDSNDSFDDIDYVGLLNDYLDIYSLNGKKSIFISKDFYNNIIPELEQIISYYKFVRDDKFFLEQFAHNKYINIESTSNANKDFAKLYYAILVDMMQCIRKLNLYFNLRSFSGFTLLYFYLRVIGFQRHKLEYYLLDFTLSKGSILNSFHKIIRHLYLVMDSVEPFDYDFYTSKPIGEYNFNYRKKYLVLLYRYSYVLSKYENILKPESSLWLDNFKNFILDLDSGSDLDLGSGSDLDSDSDSNSDSNSGSN